METKYHTTLECHHAQNEYISLEARVGGEISLAESGRCVRDDVIQVEVLKDK